MLEWQELENSPFLFSNLAPAPEIHTPVFPVSAVALELDEDLKRAIEPPTDRGPAHDRAGDRASGSDERRAGKPGRFRTTFAPAAPSASTRPEPPLHVPAMASRADPEPHLGSEALPAIAPAAAGEQLLAGRTPEPVQPSIENSAHIKNWRLKITFATPA